MTKDDILKLHTYEQDGYNKNTIPTNPTYATRQKDIVDLIDYYWVDRFRDGDFNKKGWKKAFLNKVVNPTLVSAKMIDLDTKDIRVTAEQGASFYPAWLFSRDLKVWMKVRDYGLVLNQMVYKLPKYGSIFCQHTEDNVVLVPIQNLSMDTDVNDLHDSTFFTQKFEYTPERLRKMGYANVEQAIQKSKNTNGRIKFYARFGSVPNQTSNFWVFTPEGVVLWDCKYDDINEVYRKLDWDVLDNRMIGRGVVEKLFEAQIQANRVENYRTEGLHWSSKHIFQTRDHTVDKNLMTDTENGDLMKVNSEITPIATEERNLAAYNAEMGEWDALISRIAFNPAELSGERPPAGTTLGTTQIQVASSASFFDQRREEVGVFFKGIVMDWIIPDFKKNSNSDHNIPITEFTAEEVSKLRNLVSNERANSDIFRFITKNRRLPTDQETMLMQKLAKDITSKAKQVTIPQSFYENLQYKIDVVITNEQIDVAAKLATYQFVLGMLNNNPEVFTNPKTKGIAYRMLDLAGISPIDLGIEDAGGEALSQGGSLPKINAAPVAFAPNTQTV